MTRHWEMVCAGVDKHGVGRSALSVERNDLCPARSRVCIIVLLLNVMMNRFHSLFRRSQILGRPLVRIVPTWVSEDLSPGGQTRGTRSDRVGEWPGTHRARGGLGRNFMGRVIAPRCW